MPIRAISLDLDDTLWAIEPVMAAADACLEDWLRRHAPRVLRSVGADGLRDLRHRTAEEHPGLAHDFTELRRISLRRAMEKAGYPQARGASLAEAAFQAFYAARNRVDCFPDVVAALERLGERYRLGVISNGNADLDLIGLAHHFDFRIHARVAGCAKPDARIFRMALETAGVEPQEMLHAGDDPEHDILGAAAVGIGTVWVNRDRRALPEGITPDATISSLADLPEIIDRLP